MAFQPAVNCAEVVVEGTRGGQLVINTFYAKKASAYTQSDIDTLASKVDEWVGDQWLPNLGSEYSYIRTRVRGLTNEIDMQSEANASAGPGGGSASSDPNNVTLAIKRRSVLTGRGARGRIYLPSIVPSAKADDNHLQAAAAAVYEGVLNALTAAMDDVDWTEVVLHRVSGGVPLPAAIAYTVVEYVVVDLVLDSMRRRLPGRGA